MTDPKSAAIAFEAVKVSMSQTRDGIKIVLAIHPNDDTQDLFNHPIGSRYQVAMVQVDDEGQPVAPARRTEGERAVTSAVMLCRDSQFINWLHTERCIGEPTEQQAAIYLKTYCDIQSRSELKTNADARAKFDGLRREFQAR